MKKWIIYSIIFIVIFIIIILPKKEHNGNITTINLAEVTHSPFYAPLYVAIEKGYFKDNNLDINLILTPGADKVSSAVLSGDTQIGLAGAESAIYIYQENNKDYLQIFSGLTKRDGQFIIGKEKIDNFTLNDLKGKEILVGRSSGMPALNFLYALKKEGINPEEININYSIDFASLSGSFIGGIGDYVNLFEPNATSLENEKLGYVLTSIGKYSGEMPYTTFYAKKSYIKNNPTIINNFTKAINSALLFVKEETPNEIAKVIINQFPDTNIEDLESNIKRYKENDSWLESFYIDEKLLINLEDLLIENKLLSSYVPYDDIILKQ